uniref:Uncharacterized protein n=1 Tax=Candidatus Kentrum sp. TC TaxID=2126339 RepID=A0A450ZQR0_9GAMM|nr:MAG: hypothetical protein BECKTC1821F_GA0114240_10095 [Candidatus Kentron sp. TC]
MDLHGLVDETESQQPRIPGGYRFREEDPKVRAVTGTGDLDGVGDIQIPTCSGHGLHRFPPAGFIEIRRQQVAGVVRQQRIQTDDLPARQVGMDGPVHPGVDSAGFGTCRI